MAGGLEMINGEIHKPLDDIRLRMPRFFDKMEVPANIDLTKPVDYMRPGEKENVKDDVDSEQTSEADDARIRDNDKNIEAKKELPIDKDVVAPLPEKIYNKVKKELPIEDDAVVTVPELIYKDVTKIDDTGTAYLKNGKLEPNINYELNGNTYITDEQGRIIYCEAHPVRSPENPRDEVAQLQAGGEDRHPLDQGGHIIGRDLSGDGGAGNLVAMDSRINQSDYKRMENDIKASLEEGKDVTVTTDIRYSGDSKRPDTLTVVVTADEVKTVYKFDNNLDGGLEDEVPANGKDAVQEELNDTNGEISSIKEEYNQNGELVETTVNITYTDENGTNHRTKVYIDAE